MQSRSLPRSSWFLRHGWALAFCLCISVVYAHGMKSRKAISLELKERLTEMEKEWELAKLEHEDLSLQLASQSDPAWIEQILLREMGVVPEGFLKVHFRK